jgi:hypothetical protein
MLIATSLALLLALPHSDFEGPPLPAGELAGGVTRVVAYKNGVSLVSVRLAGSADGSGELRYVLPPADLVVGGVWLTGDAAPTAVRAATREEDELRPVGSLVELLEVNIGRSVSLSWLPRQVTTLTDGGGTLGANGVIERLIGGGGVPSPYDRSLLSGPQYVVLGPDPSRGQPLGRNSLIVAVDDLLSVNGENLRTEVVRPKVLEWALEFDTEPNTRFECDLHFLARGIAWRALHRVEGDLAGDEAYTLAVELSNDLIDLAGTQVWVVAGEPNFKYADLASFLSAPRSEVGADAARSSGPVYNFQQQVGSPNAFANNAYVGRSEPEASDNAAPTGSAEGDLTRIAIGSVDLTRGGRTIRRVSEAVVPVRHVYTLDLDVRRGSQNGVEVRDTRAPGEHWEPAYKGGFARARRSKVWHQLELENTGTLPWTTGPVVVVKSETDGPFPLAQEDLRYTPIGGKAQVPLNLALDVDLEFHEEAQGDDGKSVTGVLALTNRVGERIELAARVGLGGRVSIVEGEAGVFASPGRDDDWTGEERNWWRSTREANPHSEIEWKIAIEPGATVTLRYVASYDVRRR